jgi:MFS family permease
MQCASKYEFGLFGSVFFFAVVISSIIFPALSDKIGRHLVLVIGISMQLVASSTLLLAGD